MLPLDPVKKGFFYTILSGCLWDMTPFVQVGAKDISVMEMRNHESQHETLTEQEMFRDAVLKVMYKACV